MQPGSVIKQGDEEYEVVPDTARLYTEGLIRIHKILNFPNDIDTKEALESAVFWKFIDQVVKAWKDCFPEEARELFAEISLYKSHEKSTEELIREQVGRSLMSWPSSLFNMIVIFFPNVKLHDKEFVRAFVHRYKEFGMSNYGI